MADTHLTDARLQTIARMIPPCIRTADIGADHGYLGISLLLEGRTQICEFTDISETSLQKARRHCALAGVLERAVFSVGDGALALKEKPDAAVIAGMGGQTIAGILERGQAMLEDALVVLQPNVGADVLRERLMRAGYRIVAEDIARAGGRWYVMIAVRRGTESLSPLECAIGPVLLRTRHPCLAGYLSFRKRVTEKALAGARQARDDDALVLEKELALLKEAEIWLR